MSQEHRPKSRYRLLYIFLAVLAVLSIISTVYRVPLSLQDLAGTVDLQTVDTIRVENGTTHLVSCTDHPLDVISFLSILESKVYCRSFTQNGEPGHLYAFELLSGDQSVLRFSNTGKHIRINQVWYDLEVPIRYEEIETWLKEISLTRSQLPE